MLLKVTLMDDPEDMPGVEKAVRTAAMIERIYSRCDRAERQTSQSRKVEAERATHEMAAIKAQVSLANTLKWGEERRRDLGQWWDAAESVTKTPAEASARPQKPAASNKSPSSPQVTYVDYTDAIEAARASWACKDGRRNQRKFRVRRFDPAKLLTSPLPATQGEDGRRAQRRRRAVRVV
jgi:hypothetical protein